MLESVTLFLTDRVIAAYAVDEMILALWHLPAPVVGCAISSLIGLLIGLLVSLYIKTKG